MLNKLEMIRIFCAAAESASFKEAAARMGVSPQAVTRAIKELEHSLGELLFHRNTRQIRITEYGEKLLEDSRSIIYNIDEIFKSNDQSRDDDISGIVRITSPVSIGRKFVVPAMAKIRAQYPNIRLDLRLSDMITDVVDEKIDVGIRVGLLRDSSFVARATNRVYLHTVATADCIAQYGRPKTIADLYDLPTIALLDTSSGRAWPWHFSQGHQFMPRHPVFIVNDSEAELEAAVNGIGYAQIATPFSEEPMRNGQLEQVLEEFAPEPWYLYVYRPQRGPVPNRIRLVFDALVEIFSGETAISG
ncbi:MAG: LysR family transcriptional regulator [Methylophilaceae bacterium]|jgi:DNA-binding transcriptional LysR family regulator|nr:LysR family transcriptional regulator [Methyloradius sp.]